MFQAVVLLRSSHLIVFCVPETFVQVLLQKKALRLRKSTGNDRWYAPIEKVNRSISQTVIHSCYRPFQLLTLEPMCLSLYLYSALLLGILYLFFEAFVVVFRGNHGFNDWQAGLTFLGMGVGIMLASLSDSLWRKNYNRLVCQRQVVGGEPGGSDPEFWLPPALLGSILILIGIFWFGWTTYPSIHWIVPVVGSGFFGAGFVFRFNLCSSRGRSH